MLRSGNDAATALAIHTGKSLEGFVKMMNDKALSLGLKNTHLPILMDYTIKIILPALTI